MPIENNGPFVQPGLQMETKKKKKPLPLFTFLGVDQTAAYRALWKETDERSGNGRRFYVTGPRENPVLRGRDMTEEELAQEVLLGQGGIRRWRRRGQEENLGSSRHKVHVLQYRHHWKKGNRADASIGKRGP
jgi:hypothetical protein